MTHARQDDPPKPFVLNFRSTAKPGDKPYAEIHRNHALAHIRRGRFGCPMLGKQLEPVVGTMLGGKPGREYMATHDHHDYGDEGLSVKVSSELAEPGASPRQFRRTAQSRKG